MKFFFKDSSGNGVAISFYYVRQLLKDNVDGKFLSTKIAGGFVGSMYAMYATSHGKATTNKVLYNWFSCIEDDVDKKSLE